MYHKEQKEVKHGLCIKTLVSVYVRKVTVFPLWKLSSRKDSAANLLSLQANSLAGIAERKRQHPECNQF